MKTQLFRLSAIKTMVAAFLCGVTVPALAANQYYSAATASNKGWSSSSSTNDWGSSSGGPYSSFWTSGNTAVFEGTAGTVTVGGGGNPTANGISFSTTGYTLSGGTINLTGTPTIDPGTGSATISSILAGSAIGITKPSAGTLTLSSANTYSGGTTINAGTLSGGNTSAFGTGAINLNSSATLAITAGTVANTLNIGAGATATFNLASGLTYSGAFAGSGAVTNYGTSYSQTRTYSSATNGGFTGTMVLERSAHVFSGNNANWSGANFQTANSSSDVALYAEFTGTGTTVINSINGFDGASLEIGPNTVLDVKSGNITRITYASVFGNVTPVILPSSGSGGLLTSDCGTLTFNCSAGPITENTGVSLVNYNASTPLNLALTGANTLTLSGANYYTGTTTIGSGGILQLSSPGYDILTGAVSGAGTLSVAAGATLDIGGAGNLISLSVGSPLNLAGGNLVYDLPGTGSADLIAMTGSPALTLIGTNLIVPVTGLANGTYTLISGAGAISGGATNFALAPVRGASATFAVSSPTVTMTVSGVQPGAALTWGGNLNGVWNVNTTANWLNGASPDYFYNLDSVTFSDSPTTNFINVVSNVYPASVTFNGSTTPYVITGAGAISGVGTLTKTGGNVLTISNANYFTGGTTISSGVVTNANTLGLGTGSVTLDSGTSRLTVHDGVNMANNVIINGGGVSGAGLIQNSSTGTASLEGGTITINANTAAGGHFGAASTGTLVVGDPINSTVPVVWRIGSGIFSGGGSYASFTIAAGTVKLGANNGLSTTAILGIGNSSTASFDLGGFNQTLAGITQLSYSATIGNSSTVNNSTLTTTGTSVYGGVIQNVIGSGTQQTLLAVNGGYLALGGANTYTGATTVTNGTLEVDGSLAAGSAVTVQNGGVLDGIGAVNGPVTVQTGGTLEGGTNSVTGTLAINNTLALQGTTSLKINKTGGTLASDLLSGMTGVIYGGTLDVANITSDGTPLAAGDTFTLFSKASGSYSGSFANLILPALSSTNLEWSTNSLAVNGTISVVGVGGAPLPLFSPAAGGYLGPVTVTISDANTTIYYTTDGSNPTNSGTVLSSNNVVTVSVPINTIKTIQAYAAETGFANSAVVTATYAPMSEGIWTNTAGGAWPVSANWSNGVVATGYGITADFSQTALAGNTTVALNGTRTIGNLIFGDQSQSYNWILTNGTGGSLTLAASATPAINVTNDMVAMGVTVDSTNGLAMTGTGTSLWPVNPAITAGGITVNSGTFEITANNFGGTFTPLITINTNATVLGNSTHSLGGGTVVVINRGTWLMNDEDYKTNLTMMDGLIASGGSGDGLGLRVGFAGANGTYTWYVTNSVAGSVVSAPISTIGSGVTLVWNVARGAAPYDLTLGGTISSSGNLIFTGNGVTSITGGNSYTGSTTVSNGTLEVDGSLTAGVTVSGGTLSGTGSIGGSSAVNNGGILAPGTTAAIGTLYIYNALVLNTGSTAVMRISATGGSLAQDQVAALSSFNAGGNLVVTNITSDGTLLADGDSFQLFSAGSYAGGFASISLPALPAGLSWDTSALLTSGTIAVSANAGPPAFSPPGGNYVGAVTVTINSTTPGATIYYTTDGSTPTSTSPSGLTPVTVVVPVNTTETLQAYSHAAGFADSPVEGATYNTQPTGVWENSSGGSWPVTGNWMNGAVPNGVDVTADFSQLGLPANTLVTLDGVETVGNLIFGDQGNTYGYILNAGAGGPLTLAVSSGSPTITVDGQTNTIGVALAGTNGLTTVGPGALVLSGANTYSGGTMVSNTTLSGIAGAFGTGAINLTAGTTLVITAGTTTNTLNIGAETCTLNLSNALTYAGTFTGSGTVTNYGSSYAQTRTYSSPTNLDFTGTMVLERSAHIFSASNANWSGANFQTANSVTSDAALYLEFTGTGTTIIKSINGLDGASLEIGPGTVLDVKAGTITRITYASGFGNFTPVIGPTGGNGGLLTSESGTMTFDCSAGPITEDAGVALADFNATTPLSVLLNGTTNTLTLDGTNTYSGATTVDGGTIEVDGSISTNTVTIGAGGALAGSGTVNGPVIIQSGGGLSTGPTNISSLTIARTLNLSGSVNLRINSASQTSDKLEGMSQVVYGGTLMVTNLSGTPSLNQTFTLFSAGSYSGSFSATNLPDGLPAGTGWSWNPANGTLSVVATVNTTPANMTSSVSGGVLTLSWPADHTAWRLLEQTNNLGAGLSANPDDWTTVPGSAATNLVNITIYAAQPSGFYRLVYP